MADSERVFVTGAGRGLGLAFTRHWLAEGRTVWAVARDPEGSEGLRQLQSEHGDRLRLGRCDVGDDASVESMRSEVAGAWDRLDLLVNNSGTYGRRGQGLEELALDEVRRVLEVNTLGPIRVTRALLPLLRKGHNPRIVNLTSLMGSIGDNGSGGSWAYRMSKTALNMATRNMAHELSADGITAIVIHPGWVATDMGGESAPLSIDDSVSSMVKTIDALKIDQTGRFLDREGKPLPW